MERMDTPLPPGLFPKEKKPVAHPFRRAVVRGMAIVFSPLLTILIFVWFINTAYDYVFAPVAMGVREAFVWSIADVREDLVPEPHDETKALADGKVYRRLESGEFVPEVVYEKVARHRGEMPMPQTPKGIYRRYVELTYLRPYYATPFLLAVFILVLYLLGKFLAAGIGAFFWHRLEQIIHRLPLIRNVYSSVKQVSDFLFTEREIQYNRVVAIEYPRKGIWSLGFVTGDSLLDIRSAANEPVAAVLIPTSPAPVTGYTVTVLRSELIDLNLTVDQAIQYIVSCGVVVPPQQVWSMSASGGPPPPSDNGGGKLADAPAVRQPAPGA
jgi:uncharacterized membrane protein